MITKYTEFIIFHKIYKKVNLRKLVRENYDDQFTESTHGHTLSTSNNFISSIDDLPCPVCKYLSKM